MVSNRALWYEPSFLFTNILKYSQHVYSLKFGDVIPLFLNNFLTVLKVHLNLSLGISGKPQFFNSEFKK